MAVKPRKGTGDRIFMEVGHKGGGPRKLETWCSESYSCQDKTYSSTNNLDEDINQCDRVPKSGKWSRGPRTTTASGYNRAHHHVSFTLAEKLGTHLEPSLVKADIIWDYISHTQEDLHKVEQKISVQETVLNKLFCKRNEISKSIKNHKALLLPVQHLPDEILAQIFMHSLQPHDDARNDDSHWTLLLAQLGRCWRAIAVLTQALWSYIYFHFGTPTIGCLKNVTLWLERSGTHPLTFFFSIQHLDIWREEPQHHQCSSAPCHPVSFSPMPVFCPIPNNPQIFANLESLAFAMLPLHPTVVPDFRRAYFRLIRNCSKSLQGTTSPWILSASDQTSMDSFDRILCEEAGLLTSRVSWGS